MRNEEGRRFTKMVPGKPGGVGVRTSTAAEHF